ncbi:phage tail sheath C-terminal domain-containing protein [Bacteroides sp. An19]|uniref:phage tail sheath family protein n=1 Tax=Bacteroides sp. An19 TaxID=1965580 RepID=UPI000B38B154|nr:phage tail sheath C-terminal domain-containing protein [Bacteroides sp. An19]OUP35619.1 phage tail protein [Bacteroides sp. An19]
MGEYKTPGVYIKEQNAFGNSIVEAETAIPVFIGLTKKALDGTESLLEKPVRISSMTEYEKYFGEPQVHSYIVSVTDSQPANQTDKVVSVKCENGKYLQAKLQNTHCTLYYHLVMFFANGGGTCYIVSVGDYKTGKLDKEIMNNTVLPALKKVQDITMLVMPEAINESNYADFYKAMLSHCAANNRFAILDVPKDVEIDDFRTNIGSNFLAYGAAYYPWLETTVLSDNDITEDVMRVDKNLDLDAIVDKTGLKEGETHPLVKYVNDAFTELDTLPDEQSKVKRKEIHNALLQNLPAYKLLAKKIKDYLNLLPPSAAMAGIYTMVDHSRGVWKAPANVSVSRADKPSRNITDNEQADLNMPMNGKAINALRAFPGEGIKVWGARTLDGNSQDWRYVNVRRTMSFLEISVKNAARAYVFEPNDANTWINMKCMIENFLRSVWKRGGLAGSTPEEAYEVHVGLGDTMTADDILEGILRITVLVAISRPAEFIEITFQQQMQKS